MANVGAAGLTFWTPNINILRDPRWGRGQETPGEDPYLTSTYAANFVSSFQGNDPTYLMASACCKHYYAYDLENWEGMDRYHFNAIVSDQDAADTYLPTFQSCVERGKASSIMCSYNSVNGVPSCANGDILTGLAREQWGFEGYITADCDAVECVIDDHHYTNDSDSTCAAVLQAGMDIDCGTYLDQNLEQAVINGAVSMETVDSALTHLFSVQYRLGMFDDASKQPFLAIPTSAVCSPEHTELALSAARQGMVLLKNDGATLPLSSRTVKVLAVVGPNADATDTLLGNYNGIPPFIISPLSGLSSYAKVDYQQGCDVACTDAAGFPAAMAAAKSADATVIVVGINQTFESEEHDRYVSV